MNHEKLKELQREAKAKCDEYTWEPAPHEVIEEIVAHTIERYEEWLRERVKYLATCKDCEGSGYMPCAVNDCPEENHRCGFCMGSGERHIDKVDLLTTLEKALQGKK